MRVTAAVLHRGFQVALYHFYEPLKLSYQTLNENDTPTENVLLISLIHFAVHLRVSLISVARLDVYFLAMVYSVHGI